MTDTLTNPNTTKLSKIRALLDKAESTAAQYPEEAEALTAKAIDMMERYRIDEAMIADAAPVQDRGKLVEVSIFVGSGPYVNTRIRLIDGIGRAHSVKAVIFSNYRGKVVKLNGFETDVALTEMLYTSLLIQATRTMEHPDTMAQRPGGVHGTTFKRAFLLGFADRIAVRLSEANKAAGDDHDTGDGRSVALVLADRSDEVDDYVFNRYGNLRTANMGAPAGSAAGAMAGISAADRADLTTDRRVTANANRALSA